MTISHPRTLLALDEIARVTMRATHQQARSPSRGGNPGIAELGRDLWSFDFTLTSLSEASAMAWEAWFSSLRGGLRPFKASQPLRRYLQAYPNGYGGLTRAAGGAFDGTAAVVSSPTSDQITIGTLPNGLTFAPGDLVSVTYATGLQALHRVLEDATSSGGAVTVTVEPRVIPGIASGNAVQLADPWCLATIEAGSGSPAFQWTPGRRADGIKFSATQAF